MINKKLKKYIELDLFKKEDKWEEYCLINQDNIEKIIVSTLNHLEIHNQEQEIECSVFLTNDKEIRIHNKKFRSKDKPTNTLSFPSGEYNNLNKANISAPHIHLGDMFFSFETISQESKEQTKNFYDHFYHLLLHSLLHLLGYEHDVEKDRLLMEKVEINILHKLGINNPYV
ncbi:MAG: rRNA maturation RNase YbeY [Alphaproteobacteria bacterium]|nr:rRNA maturation RNase YbeY [Alphaproteobacteria bacterium]